jgi:hypothetical protein
MPSYPILKDFDPLTALFYEIAYCRARLPVNSEMSHVHQAREIFLRQEKLLDGFAPRHAFRLHFARRHERRNLQHH